MRPYGKRFEDYLKIIYVLQTKSGEVRLKEVANAIGSKPPTALQYINKLCEMGLAQYSQGRVKLTERGLKKAEELLSRFEKIRKFFVEVMNMDEKRAEEVACLIEHVLDEDVIKRMEELRERIRECTTSS